MQVIRYIEITNDIQGKNNEIKNKANSSIIFIFISNNNFHFSKFRDFDYTELIDQQLVKYLSHSQTYRGRDTGKYFGADPFGNPDSPWSM